MLCEDSRYSTVAEFGLQSVCFCGEGLWGRFLISNFSFLVGALVREADERLQVFTRVCERWADCLNQDFQDGGCPPARERPYECLREFTRDWRESKSVYERLHEIVKGLRRMWDGQPANSAWACPAGRGWRQVAPQRGSCCQARDRRGSGVGIVQAALGGSGGGADRCETKGPTAKRVVRMPGSYGCERQYRFTGKTAVSSLLEATRYRDMRDFQGRMYDRVDF